MTMLDRRTTYGFGFIALILLLVAGTVATYKGAFKSTVPLTVESSRAGLTLASGSPVKLRGVVVGRVGRITSSNATSSDEVEIKLDIAKDQFDLISSDVTAEIVPPTAFGAKYIQLNPGKAGAARIQAGSTIRADKVTVEVDEAFENLTKVLTAARPAQVNAALTAVAQSVDQRGEVLGDLITQTDKYLTSFNPFLASLTSDIRAGRKVAATYAAATPDLVALARSAGITSQTLVDQQASLHAFELSLTSFSAGASKLLDSSGTRLTTAMGLLAPVADVVAKYSPELPCTVLGLASANKLAEAAVGGTHPGITTITRLVPAREPYKYGRNLPRIGDTQGPACYGLPYVTPEEAEQASPFFDTGANPYVGKQPTPGESTLTTLFGLLAGGANLVGGQK
jgi:phospholipid/cholesterol/gamma-HCH transport system substrate-binding protein